MPGRLYGNRRVRSRDTDSGDCEEDSGNEDKQRGEGKILSRDGSPSVMEKIIQPLQFKNQ
jgi:hypothetical protein